MRLRSDTRAVLFDLDGTLLDHEAARDAGLLAMLGEDRQLTAEQKRHYVAIWGKILNTSTSATSPVS